MKRLFNDNWKFCLVPVGETPKEDDFKPVDIPHDWLVWDTYNLYKSGDGWYKKTFTAEKTAGRLYSLRFEGVYMDSEIYLNGEKVCEWKYGYTTFDVPLALKDGENVIRVRVRYQEPNTRWYSGAGIFRNVWLRETGLNRIAEDGTYVVSYIEGVNWRTEIDTEIECECACTVKHTLFDADGEVAASCRTNVPEGTKRVSQSFEITEPYLWSVDKPYLYSLLTELMIGDESVDQRFERVGYKYVRYDKDKGFFLNGKNIKLNGVCMHHDLGALGAAFNRAAAKRQLLSLKEMGVNAIRTSHNPPAVELMELCDEMGFLVDSEILDMWQNRKTTYDYARFFDDWHERDVRSWIRRDRNHVSVIMWSIGNEIGDTNDIPRGVEITKELTRCVRIDDYKNAHPVTIASNHMRWQGAQNCAEELGTVGYNYLESIYDDHHKKYPHWVIYGSETGSTIQSRGIYHFPAAVSTTTYDDMQCSSLLNCATGWGAQNVEYNITMDRNRRYSLGQFIWTGWDYIGEPTPFRTKNSYFGHSDTAGFPKDSYFAYKAEWNKDAKPFIHLFPYWDFNEGQLVDIFAFTNCPKSEVFLNGESLGVYEYDPNGDRLTGRWQAKYQKGEIKAVGYDEYGNKICEHVRRSFKDAAKIVLKPDRTTMFANGEDMMFVEVSTVDKDGNPVENDRSRINVEVSGAGRLVGMDNGDSSDYEQYKTNSRRLFSGKLLIMIAAKTDAGDIEMKVSSPALPDETLKLRAIPARAVEGISCSDEVIAEAAKCDIPLRKIELKVTEQVITPESGEVRAEVRLLPENTTRDISEIGFKAVSENGIETNVLDIEAANGQAILKPRGDGVYRLRAYCKNRNDCVGEFEEIISEFEMENRGFGPASFEPYGEIICASLCSNISELGSCMEGGVFVGDGTRVLFKNVDFGKAGSDEITIGIYTYNENPIPVGLYVGAEELMTLEFQAKNEWNTYKYNTFSLPKRLKGLQDIEFRFSENLQFKGFKFASPRRVGAEIFALDSDAVYGDSYTIGGNMIEHIGNNVSIVFGGVDLSGGVNAVEITGRTHNQKDTVLFKFSNGTDTSVEFPASEDIVTKKLAIAPVEGMQDLSVVFLPGSDFDLVSVKFIKE